ncbi:hypothetical protein JI735_33845 (plasmid) [Paenibacillus sonchi]|uniref:Uncharacterized protein n=1 Tax=Paenibacillus sonchi TaxID=373687 RepID=A0A974PIN0_9BACL|nr:hypothetical protein [Paenibacillus sonchi]QQZ64635.1 hypothetical protein JI735_33845 [Paenibacillus sonchi]
MSEFDVEEVLTKEELESKRKEDMREHLIDVFDGDSILYEIYKTRNWLEKLFTDPILMMDTRTLYNTTQVAAICEVPTHLVNNRRRDLVDYIKPDVFGEESNKVFKHNYISVFKIKMVIGLTGEGGEYSVPNIREIIFNGAKLGVKTTSHSNSGELIGGDQLVQILNTMKKFEKFQEMIESDDFFKEIEKRVTQTTEKLLSSSKDNKGVDESKKLYDYICSGNGTLLEKEETINNFDTLIRDFPDQLHMIQMYKSAAEERIIKIRQDEKELSIKKLKIRISDLIDSYGNAQNDKERESIMTQINRLSSENPDLNFEIRLWMATISKKTNQKGFFSRLFSK